MKNLMSKRYIQLTEDVAMSVHVKNDTIMTYLQKEEFVRLPEGKCPITCDSNVEWEYEMCENTEEVIRSRKSKKGKNTKAKRKVTNRQ